MTDIPVLKIPVDDSEFKAFAALYEKFQKAAIMTLRWRLYLAVPFRWRHWLRQARTRRMARINFAISNRNRRQIANLERAGSYEAVQQLCSIRALANEQQRLADEAVTRLRTRPVR